jgi:hypothetical protein
MENKLLDAIELTCREWWNWEMSKNWRESLADPEQRRKCLDNLVQRLYVEIKFCID